MAANKGGVGKTTTAVHVAHYAALQRQRVLLVDLDGQGQAASFLGAPAREVGVFELLVCNDPSREDYVRAGDTVTAGVRPGLDVVVSGGEALAAAERELMRGAGHGRAEHRLLERLSELWREYDLCVIDLQPSLSLLSVAALYASALVIAPVAPGHAAREGVTRLEVIIGRVGDALARQPYLLGVVPTLVDEREGLGRDLVRTLTACYGARVAPTIHRAATLMAVPERGQSVFEFAPKSRAACEYALLGTWVLSEITRWEG